MDIGSIFLILAFALLVGVFISQPFFDRKLNALPVAVVQTQQQAGQVRSTLLAERDRLLSALQELDFDHALGKVSAEDYAAHRAALLQAGVQVLRRLDEIDAAPSGPAGSVEQRIEAVVAARRADRAAPPVADDLEELIAARRRARQEKSAGFCSRCGSPLQKSDRFCARCGQAVQS